LLHNKRYSLALYLQFITGSWRLFSRRYALPNAVFTHTGFTARYRTENFEIRYQNIGSFGTFL